MDIQKVLILASALKLKQKIKQLQDQGIFHYIQENQGCALNDFNELEVSELQKFGQILDLLVNLEVLNLNSTGEYYCNQSTKSYLDLLENLEILTESTQLEQIASLCQTLLSRLAEFQSIKMQHSLMIFMPILLERLYQYEVITPAHSCINWSKLDEKYLSIFQQLFLILSWVSQENHNYLTQQGQQEIAYLNQLTKCKSTHSLSIFPEGDGLIEVFENQVMTTATDLKIDCVVYISHLDEIDLISRVSNRMTTLGIQKQLVVLGNKPENGIADLTTISFSELLQGKARLWGADSQRIMWVILSPKYHANEQSQIITRLHHDLAPKVIEGLMLFKSLRSFNKKKLTLVDLCFHLLDVNINARKLSVAEHVSDFASIGYLPQQQVNTVQSIVGDLQCIHLKLTPSDLKLSFISSSEIKVQEAKSLGLSVREARNFIEQFSQWQFKLQLGTQSVYLLTHRINKETNLHSKSPHEFTALDCQSGSVLHIMRNVYSTLTNIELKLISFLYTLAGLSNEIDQVVFAGSKDHMSDLLKITQEVRMTSSANSEISCCFFSLPTQRGLKLERQIIHSNPLSTSKDAINIVGYALKTPGANDIHAFWRLHEEKKDVLRNYVFSDRIPLLTKDNDTRIYKGGLLDQHLDLFDADFFGISSFEATYMDPQQRLLLETTWHALEHAGVTQQQLSQAKTGVFVGASNQDFSKLIAKYSDLHKYNRFVNAGGHNGTLAGRLAYFLKTSQASIVIDTACASSMTALYYAKESLQRGDIDYAIVAGVNLILSPEFTVGDESMGVLSNSGEVRSFSDDADGYLRSEGIAVIVLTRERLALENQLTSRASLLAVQINQENKAKYFGMPGVESQVNVQMEALASAYLQPEDIDVIEAHATATKGGDAIELNALHQVYGGRRSGHPLFLSSSKSNIGHTEAASGLIGIIKILLAMEKEIVPAQIHYNKLNEKTRNGEGFSQLIQIPLEHRPWLKKEGHIRRAAITSLSYSGANTHAIVSEPTQMSVIPELILRTRWKQLGGSENSFKIPEVSSITPNAPLIISAKSEAALVEQIKSYQQYLTTLLNTSHETWLNIAYTSTACRDHFDRRIIIIANCVSDALSKLQQPIEVLQNPNFTSEELEPKSQLIEAKLRYKQDMVFKFAIDRYWSRTQFRLDDVRLQSLSDQELQIIWEAQRYCYSFVGMSIEQISKNLSLDSFYQDLMKAFQTGHLILWKNVWYSQVRQQVNLPQYSFQRKKYWPFSPVGQIEVLSTPASIARHADDKVLIQIFNQITHQKIENIDIHFFDLGGNSIKLSNLKQAIFEQLGVDIPLKKLFELNTVRKIADALPSERQPLVLQQIQVNLKEKHQPFPLTPIQQAYAYGRELPIKSLGGVSTHLYYEIDWEKLDVDKFEQSFNTMIRRHDMLHAIINPSGQQVILEKINNYSIRQHDFRQMDTDAFNASSQVLRNELSHEKFKAGQWPLFRVEVIQGRESYRILLSFDCLIMDMFSLHLLMREWFQNYQNSEQLLEPIALSFRDYVLATQSPLGQTYKNAKAYWLKRIESLPSAPELPLKISPSDLQQLKFTRACQVIPADKWQSIKTQAARHQLSPTSVLLSIFGAVIARWSTTKSFLLNLTLFSRQSLHKEVHQILGDFTITELLALDTSSLASQSFIDYIRVVHDRLWDDLEHNAFDGVSVARELIKQRQFSDNQIVAPVVFTSLLNLAEESEGETWLSKDKMVYGITQTPQVHLDHKTFEKAGTLIAEWDYPQGLFDDNLIADMLTCYCELVKDVADLDWKEKLPLALPNWQKSVIDYKPIATFPNANQGLHHLFEQARRKYPNSPAIVSEDLVVNYQQLYMTAQSIAKQLVDITQPNELIAVLCPPGWRQIAACLGIQYAGGAYVPFEASLPEKYLSDLLIDTDAKAIIGCDQFSDLIERICEEKRIKKIMLDKVAVTCEGHIDQGFHPDNLAYVIFTSGTTGKPKGVMISHQAAVNTVLDINQRYGVNQKDKIFGVSKLNFDLSVYDIYGLLAVGGQVVYPAFAEDKDVARWYELCRQNEVTIWNSVPMIVEMLVSYMALKQKFDLKLPNLRLIMMSGDWIPVHLPKQINQYCPNPELIRLSLGGATEGSIWSIAHEITQIPSNWTSIPYGKALTNQTMMILDELMQPLPIGIEGDIYIGGVGVAKGYWRNSEKTSAAFRVNPLDGHIIYRTGDRGYKDRDGVIVFCGRLDSQVKINGYRIELGGITTCLNQTVGIEDSAVIPVEHESGKKLVAFVKRHLPLQFERMKNRMRSKLSPDEKKHFNVGSQQTFHQKRLQGLKRIELSPPHIIPSLWYGRKSYRQFNSEKPVTKEDISQLLAFKNKSILNNVKPSLSALLSVCAAACNESHLLPKYVYPSAGSTYSVKLYVLIGPGNDEVDAGTYYYHAVEHVLYQINKEEYASGISLINVAHGDLIQPLYGERGVEFSDYEQGQIKVLLSIAANDLGWQLHPQELDGGPNFTDLLNLNNEQDRVLSHIKVQTTSTHESQKSLSPQVNCYVYVQKNCTLSEGLYQWNNGELINLNVQSPYPILFDHPGDNANIFGDASVIILLTDNGKQVAHCYRHFGELAQIWMLNALEQHMGICAMGLPIMPEALCQLMLGDVQMAYTLGHVDQNQLEDKMISVSRKSPISLGLYLYEHLKRQEILPKYAIPEEYIIIPSIPLTGNGKVDRSALLKRYAEQNSKKSSVVRDQKKPMILKANTMDSLVVLVEKTLGKQIQLDATWAENGIRSYNSVTLRVVLEENDFILSINDILKDESVADCLQKIWTRSEHFGLDPQPSPQVQISQSLATPRNHEPIAIIGMSARFPGANDLDAFWRLLRDGIDGLKNYPLQDDRKMKRYGAIGSLLDFDHQFFRMSPKEATLMHPGQRVWIESVWHALEHAGYAGKHGERIGVYASFGGEPYLKSSYYEEGGLEIRTKNEVDYLSARSAFEFNFTGPVLTIQSACSSSLAAIHMAINSIRNGEATMMVAGGVHTSRFNQLEIPNYPKRTIFSQHGQCQPFSSQADGIVETQGVGVVILKPLSKAMADGDCIYATVLGSALNNDGHHKRDFTSPNGDAQRAVISYALKDAGVNASSITAIEGHGTGTPMGDPIEFEALKAFYGGQHSVALGSVKSNIGHTVTAAGVAGFMKMVLSLHHKKLPASLHIQQPNPELRLHETSFELNTQTKHWKLGEPLRGAISSFGIGGTNAHAILEEAPEIGLSDEARLAYQWEGLESKVPAQKSRDEGPWLFVLSAKTSTALDLQVKQLLEVLNSNTTLHLADLSYTLSVGRAQMAHRLALEAADADTLKTKLLSYQKPTLQPSLYLGLLSDAQLLSCHKWYEHDAYYHTLMNASAEVFASLGLGCLSEVLPMSNGVGQARPALSVFYQYHALKRYELCGIKLDKCIGGAQGLLAYRALKGELSLEQALHESMILGNVDLVSSHSFCVGDGLSTFREIIRLSFIQEGNIDWRAYWRGSVRQKLSLPLYPFERQRFWQEPSETREARVLEPQATGLLGVGPIAMSDNEWLYQQELSLDSLTFSYLSGHRVLSSCVFPGAGYTEMLISAARRLDENAMIEINELHYQEPLQLVKGERRICQVILRKTEGSRFEALIISFVSGTSKHQAITHAQGHVTLLPQSHQKPYVDINRLSQPYTQVEDIEAIYTNLAADGVHYTDSFRGVKSFAYNVQGTKGLAQISLDGGLLTSGHSIHPILLDSAFQSLAGILLLKQAIPEGMTYIPAGHANVRFFREMSSTGYAQVNRHHPTESVKERRGDIAIYTQEGHLSLMVYGFLLAQVPKAMLEKRLGIHQDAGIHYQLQYMPANVVASQTKRNWLLLGEDSAIRRNLSIELSHYGDNVTEMDLLRFKADDLTSLTGSLGVIYLGSLLSIEPGLLASHVWHLMTVLKALMQSNARVNRFMVLTSNGLSAQANDEVIGYAQGVYRGFCASLSAARPGWQVSLVDVDDVERKDMGSLLSAEARQDENTEMLVGYRQHRRLVGRLIRNPSTMLPALSEKLFVEGEVCLVTGGLGGLGLRVSEWLVSKGARRLILLNRKLFAPLPAIIETWQRQGVSVEVNACDVSDRFSLQTIFKGIAAQQYQLVGVFHLAGLLRDALLEQLREEDFHAVFSPKVIGGENLHQITLNAKTLRYFVLFSSLVSLIGSPGQLNYAAANSYLDSLSERRRAMGLPAQRLNFGAWAEAGMAANLTNEQRRNGMEQISVNEGLDAMGAAMSFSHSQLTVARVDWQSLWRTRRQHGLVNGLVKEKINDTAKNLWAVLNTMSLVEREKHLQEYIISNLVEATGKKISFFIDNIDKGFSDLGLESMDIDSISQKIREDLPEHVDLKGSLLYDYPTIQSLIKHLLSKMNTEEQNQKNNSVSSKMVYDWVETIRSRKNTLSLREQAIMNGNLGSVRSFARLGNLVASNHQPSVPLTLLAAMAKDEKMMELLVENRLDVNSSLSTNPSITPLSVAVAIGNYAVVQYLLTQHCEVRREFLEMESSPQIKQLLEDNQTRRYEKK